jgi:hypothetical protein
MKAALATLFLSSALGLQAGAQAQGQSTTAPTTRSAAVTESIRELLELSLKNGKGLMFYLGSQSLGGAVTKIGEQTVEVRNREHSRIVIRLDRIDAVAMN